jgi:hypothetical protein
MNRRNLLIGLGSIAAGGATFVGTGAVSSVEAQRGVTGRVVGDGSAYLSIEPGADHGFAVENTDGEFYVAFDNDPDGGDGLNADSVNTFDDVFRIRNTGPEALGVYVADSHPRLGFYFGEAANDGSPTDSETGVVTVDPAQEAVVGMWVDLRDRQSADVLGTGDDEDFTIHAVDESGDETDTRG